MIWLKHMVLALAAAVMTAGPAMSCCMPDHSSASVMSEAAHDARKSHHNKQTMSATGHPCDEQSNITSEHHSTGSENNSACSGCADCTYMTAQAKVHFAAIQIKVDHEPEQLVQLQAFELTAQPHLLAKFIKPPATAPPLALSPVHLKQILIV